MTSRSLSRKSTGVVLPGSDKTNLTPLGPNREDQYRPNYCQPKHHQGWLRERHQPVDRVVEKIPPFGASLRPFRDNYSRWGEYSVAAPHPQAIFSVRIGFVVGLCRSGGDCESGRFWIRPSDFAGL